MSEFLESDIKFLPGVGPKRAEILAREAEIFTFRDLLTCFPYKYVDKTRIYKVSELDSSMQYVQLKGKILRFGTEGGGSARRLIADFGDETGIVRLVWFKGLKWVTSTYKTDTEYIIFGKPSLFGSSFNIIHPEIEEAARKDKRVSSSFEAQYNTTEKMKDSFLNSRALAKMISTCFKG